MVEQGGHRYGAVKFPPSGGLGTDAPGSSQLPGHLPSSARQGKTGPDEDCELYPALNGSDERAPRGPCSGRE